MSDVRAKVLRGTTHRGQTLNEGDVVMLDRDTFVKLSMTQDVVEMLPEPNLTDTQKAESLTPKKKPATA